tara:strand:- start:412 stop:1251 length:840 start_codon:yes stop_codon:yes gene_type:complete
MEEGERGKRRRGPPASKRKRSPPTQTTPLEEDNWYGDVVDESESEDGGFGGFAVKRPQMSGTDQVEGQQLERYFEKQYHGKTAEKRDSIEEDWDETESEFNLNTLLNGYRSILLGVQSFMTALPLLIVSAIMMWVGDEIFLDGMANSTGAFLNILAVFLAISLTAIAFIQIVVSAVNQSLRDRQIARDGPDIPLLGWSGSLRLSGQVFSEVLLTFIVTWVITILGLYMIAGGMPDLSIPTIDPDNLSAGTVLYILGSAGSLFVMIGIIPYSIEATIKRS